MEFYKFTINGTYVPYKWGKFNRYLYKDASKSMGCYLQNKIFLR